MNVGCIKEWMEGWVDVWINKRKGDVNLGDKEKEEALPRRKQRWLIGGSDFAFKGPCICPSALVTPCAWQEETGDARAGLQGLGSHGPPALWGLKRSGQIRVLWEMVWGVPRYPQGSPRLDHMPTEESSVSSEWSQVSLLPDSSVQDTAVPQAASSTTTQGVLLGTSLCMWAPVLA